MNTFSAQTESDAVVQAPRSDIWAALTDPDLLPRLTPFLERIESDGDLWRWELSRIPILGVAIAPRFTERMTFEPETRIEYRHAPPAGPPSAPASRAGTGSTTSRTAPACGSA